MCFLDLSLPEKTKVIINKNSYVGQNINVDGKNIIIDGQIVSTSESEKLDIHVYGCAGLFDLKSGKISIQYHGE